MNRICVDCMNLIDASIIHGRCSECDGANVLTMANAGFYCGFRAAEDDHERDSVGRSFATALTKLPNDLPTVEVAFFQDGYVRGYRRNWFNLRKELSTCDFPPLSE